MITELLAPGPKFRPPLPYVIGSLPTPDVMPDWKNEEKYGSTLGLVDLIRLGGG